VSSWTCPTCKRQFGRANQSHGCAPALSEDEYFTSAKPLERPIFAAVYAELMDLDPLVIDFVDVGIFFKRVRTFAELRPMRDRVRLAVLLSREVTDRRVVRSLRLSGQRHALFVDLRSATDVDDTVREWLLESYAASPE
jgi:hypothetical protein